LAEEEGEMETTPKCNRMAAVREVTSAAEDPRPVLFVWWIARGRGLNGGKASKDEMSGGSDMADNCRQYALSR